MGKTRDLFKKIRDTKGTFHGKMGTIKEVSSYPEMDCLLLKDDTVNFTSRKDSLRLKPRVPFCCCFTRTKGK